MIDYTKIVIKNRLLADFLLGNLLTLFESHRKRSIENANGTTTHTYFAEYKGLTFKITESGAIIIEGSLHKFMNNGEHNYNDFSYTCLLATVKELCERFQINPHQAEIHNLEIGVNLITQFRPTEFTDRCIFLFTNGGVIKPTPITKNDSKGFHKGIRFEMTEYCLKIYNKSLQYSQEQNILRVEYKTKKSRVIETVNIKTLADFCNIEKLRILAGKYLTGVYNNLLIDEIVNLRNLSSLEKAKYNKRLDYPSCWKNVSRTQRKRNRDYIREIYRRHAETDFKSLILDLINQKSSILLSETAESVLLVDSIQSMNCIRLHPI